jgi:phage terminase small subunit
VGAKTQLVRTPAGLGKRAGAIFRRYAEVLGDRVEPEDAGMLGMLAIAELLAIENAKLVLGGAPGRQMKLLETDEKHGNEDRKSPAFTQWRQATETALKLAREFGMTPAARRRLGFEEVIEEIDVATMLYQDDPAA